MRLLYAEIHRSLEVAWELGHNVDKYRWTIDDVLKAVHHVTGYESSLYRPCRSCIGRYQDNGGFPYIEKGGASGFFGIPAALHFK